MGFLRAIRRRVGGIAGPRWRTTVNDGPLFQLGYVIPVSHEIHNAMRRLQLVILRAYGLAAHLEESPHITLKQAFPIRNVEPFERYFDRLVAEIEPFQVRVRDVGFFDEGIVFFDVAPSSQLSALRSRIVHDLSSTFDVSPNPIEDDRYHFHATVADNLAPGLLEHARRSLDTKHIDFQFDCGALAMLLHTGRGWITYKYSPLGRVASGTGRTNSSSGVTIGP